MTLVQKLTKFFPTYRPLVQCGDNYVLFIKAKYENDNDLPSPSCYSENCMVLDHLYQHPHPSRHTEYALKRSLILDALSRTWKGPG